MLRGIPRSGVDAVGLGGELLLGEAHASVGASVGANRALASDSFVVRVADALPSGSITAALVRALNNRVGVVGILHVADPGGISKD